MPKAKRNGNNDASKPLISFEKISYEKAAFKLSQTVLGQLRAYAAYVNECTGQEPALDEVVEKGMLRLFEADKGFKVWRQKQNGAAGKTALAETNGELEKTPSSATSLGERWQG